MLAFVRDLAGVWADNRFVRANRVLRRKLMLVEGSAERLSQTVDRLRARRAMDRDVRVRAEVEVERLTGATQNLAWVLTDLMTRRAESQADAALDADAVRRALKARDAAADEVVRTRKVRLACEAAYREAYNGVYIRESGPEHVRKAVAEDRASVERAARDAAEVDELAAEEARRLAELGWRSAMAGAAPGAGE